MKQTQPKRLENHEGVSLKTRLLAFNPRWAMDRFGGMATLQLDGSPEELFHVVPLVPDIVKVNRSPGHVSHRVFLSFLHIWGKKKIYVRNITDL